MWAKGIGRNVEANAGFIQSSSKNWGPFEGFVAVKDKEASARSNGIPDIAQLLIGRLPWTKEDQTYEKPKRPIYTYNIINYAI